MGNIEPPVKFCDDCPFANGVDESDSVRVWSAGAVVPNPGVAVDFVGSDGRTTHRAETGPSDDWDSTMAGATARDTVERVRSCKGSETSPRTLLGLKVGNMTVKHCGAFPDQNPKKPRIPTSSDGWMFQDYGGW